MLLVVDLSQDCGSIVLHASFDADPLPPVSSCLVNIVCCICYVGCYKFKLVSGPMAVMRPDSFVNSSTI